MLALHVVMLDALGSIKLINSGDYMTEDRHGHVVIKQHMTRSMETSSTHVRAPLGKVWKDGISLRTPAPSAGTR
jgi:hypothetical protein